MKKLSLLFLLTFVITVNAQFKSDSDTKIDLTSRMIKTPTSSFVLGFINPNNLFMNHSFSMSYMSAGGNGLALGVYTNSLYYKISDKMNVLLETSIVNSPYSTLGREAANSINGIYIRRAEFNYRISKNSSLSIQFSNDPTRTYSPFGYGNYYGDRNFGRFLINNEDEQ